MDALREQLDQLFEPDSISSNVSLVQAMTSEHFVPISVVLQLPTFQKLAATEEMLVKAAEESGNCSLSEDKTMVRPNITTRRNTVILRDVSSDAAKEKVELLFDDPKPVELRPDVFDTWFVVFENEADAEKALAHLQTQTFDDKPVRARVKVESILRQVGRVSGQKPPAFPPRGFDQQQIMMFGMQQQQYQMPPYYDNMMYYPQGGYGGGGEGFYGDSGEAHQRGKPRGGRQRRDGALRDPRSGGAVAPPAGKDGQKGSARGGGKKEKPKKKEKTPIQVRSPPAVTSSHHFPALPGADKEDATAVRKQSAGYNRPFKQYPREELLFCIKQMSAEDVRECPEGMDPDVHGLVVSLEADVDLSTRQRTVSMDQVFSSGPRKIRTDSVDSVDFRSMVHGEGEKGAPTKPKSKPKQQDAVKGYAAALMSPGSEARVVKPAPVAEPPVVAPVEEVEEVVVEEEEVPVELPTPPAPVVSAPEPPMAVDSAPKAEQESFSTAPTSPWGQKSFADVLKGEEEARAAIALKKQQGKKEKEVEVKAETARVENAVEETPEVAETDSKETAGDDAWVEVKKKKNAAPKKRRGGRRP